MTAEDLLRTDPGMPMVVAEYLAKRAAQNALLVPPVEDFGLDSIAQLARMRPEELGPVWVKGHDFAERVRRGAQRAGCSVPASLDSALRARKPEVYGAVPAGPDRAFVLFRVDQFAGPWGLNTPFPNIAALRRTPEGWRIQARDDLLLAGILDVCSAGRF